MTKQNVNKDGRGMNAKGKIVSMPKLTPVKPTEAITAKGQKATGLGKSTKDNRFASTAKTPVKSASKGFAGSASPLGTSIKLSQPTKPSNIAKAVGAAASIGAATGFQVVKQSVVSEATKKLQRELSKETRVGSNKDIRNMPRAKREEISYVRATQRETPEDYLEGRAYKSELRKQISESMKKTTKTKNVIKKK